MASFLQLTTWLSKINYKSFWSRSFSWTFSDSSLGGRHSVQLIKTLSETNQGTRIESRWRRKEIDGAGVKTSLTLYSLLWQSRHFQRTHATLHPAWRGSYCPVVGRGCLELNCWHKLTYVLLSSHGLGHAEFCSTDCYSALLQLSAWKSTAGFTSTFSGPGMGMWVKCSTL